MLVILAAAHPTLLRRVAFPDFCEPCLPSPASRPLGPGGCTRSSMTVSECWCDATLRAYEATLSEAEKRQFRALRRVHPAKWRAAIALKQSECLTTAAHDAAPRPRKIRPKSTAQQANNGGCVGSSVREAFSGLYWLLSSLAVFVLIGLR
jgi:hypothetical protein